MAFTLPNLPYAYDALEPHIDARTMEIHHSKHHQTYVNGLNAALEKHTNLNANNIEELLRTIKKAPEDIRTAIRNHGGGHANHSLFWQIMGPRAGGAPTGAIADALSQSFGSFDQFKEKLSAAGLGRFGSGWAWLIKDASGKLAITSTPNQDNPLMDVAEAKGTPILGLDVWEHAYYLNYQNRRPDYVTAFWNVVNWKEVSKKYEASL